ncbi:hypothetical protein [Streptomyces sp. BRA346]|uniref:hypothetical protein n=1 Tax=Streptomyces sp. BRA346 TaxID=2878199 RepID=UPI0040629CCE
MTTGDEKYVRVTVRNEGRLAVSVDECFLDMEQGSTFGGPKDPDKTAKRWQPPEGEQNVKLPYRLEAHSSFDWWIPMPVIEEFFEGAPKGSALNVRPIVYAGGKKHQRKQWLAL